MTQPYVDAFANDAGNGGSSPAWLAPVRRRAIDRAGTLGFPTTKNEDWHFTSVAPIADRVFRKAKRSTVDAADLAAFDFGRPEWPRLVFVNGHLDQEWSTVGALPRGVRVQSLAAALANDPTLAERHFTRLAAFEQQTFTALNTAFAEDGALIHIAAGSAVATPIHLVYVTRADAADSAAYPRALIVVERQADVTVIESYVSAGQAAPAGHTLTNAVTEISLGEGATLRHCKVQREHAGAFHVGTVEVRQARDSHLKSFAFATGAALSRTNICTVLEGEGSGATLDGLYLLDGRQHCDHQTRIEHAAPNTFSRELYKGILDDASHGVFNGKVYVRPEAQKTDGKQTNNTLLLSDKARIDTKPQLEIFADDVKCTHGATVGQLDATALFYLKSRGIPADTARQVLTWAFAADVLERLEQPDVRQSLEALVRRRFTGSAS